MKVYDGGGGYNQLKFQVKRENKMSYTSENYLNEHINIKDILEFIELLGYKRTSLWGFEGEKAIARFEYFDETDYHSWSGISLSIYKIDKNFVISTRTPIARSYYDLEYQNYTIRSIKRFLGGTFATDEGKGRYLHTSHTPPSPSQSGCHIAFQRFGHNLIRVKLYLEHRNFPKEQWGEIGAFQFIDEINPRLLSNNLVLPYLVSVIEDYFRSTFVSLLKYSTRKDNVFKNIRLTQDHLSKISSGELSVENAVAENLSFQNISSICQHFTLIDPKLDLAGSLKKPYRRRKKTLFETMEGIISSRHRFIHHGEIDIFLND